MPRPKRPRQYRGSERRESSPDSTSVIPSAAFTRAYEAEIVHGEADPPRLIKWAGADADVWADRHHILHLLDAVPDTTPLSPTQSFSSWSLPSDAEESFALSGDEELSALAENRRRHWVEGLREARLREREREDEDSRRKVEQTMDRFANDPPTPEILKLMEHTASALASSPNAAGLEMRILTRQANDTRFEFMKPRGRSAAVWQRVKAKALAAAGARGGVIKSERDIPRTSGRSHVDVMKSSPQSTQAAGSTALGGLGGYDSYSSTSRAERHRHVTATTSTTSANPAQPPEPEGSPPPLPLESPPALRS